MTRKRTLDLPAVTLKPVAALGPTRERPPYSMQAWYAFYAKPNCEAQAVESLVIRGLTAHTLRSRRTPNGPGELVFPRYVFFYGDLVAAGMSVARYLTGLGEIVSFDGQPAIVPAQAVAWMQALVGGFDDATLVGGVRAAERGLPADLQLALRGSVSPEQRAHILLRFLHQAHETKIDQVASQVASPVATAVRERPRRRTRGRGREIHYKDRSTST